MELTNPQRESTKFNRPEGIAKFIALMRNLSQYPLSYSFSSPKTQVISKPSMNV